jgi:hypothetical protein
MFGLTHGELFIVTFVVFAVVSARFWPKLGERIALMAAGRPVPPPGKEPDPDRGSA